MRVEFDYRASLFDQADGVCSVHLSRFSLVVVPQAQKSAKLSLAAAGEFAGQRTIVQSLGSRESVNMNPITACARFLFFFDTHYNLIRENWEHR